MRTVEEIKKHLTAKNRISAEVSIHSFNDAANNCINSLWNDEIINYANLINENEHSGDRKIPYLICLTNKNRLFVCKENAVNTQGFIFTSTSYSYEVKITELEYVDANKCRILEHVNTSFFGKPLPAVYGNLILNDKTVLTRADIKVLKNVYNAVIKSINGHKEQCAKKKNNSKADKELTPTPASNNVAEIRKLYEDGIITREEMLDLIKSITSK